MKIISWTLAILLVHLGHLNAQKVLSQKKLMKDYGYVEKLITAHPDPFTHISEAVFKAKVDSIRSTLTTEHTVLEFYKKVAATVALIKDGHSSVSMPKDWLKDQRKKHGVFPYEMHLTNDDELYILKNHGVDDIPLGSKVIAINGMNLDSFLRVVDPYISYELHRFRNTQVDSEFEFYLYLVFGKSSGTEITYFAADTVNTVVENIPYKAWKQSSEDQRENRIEKILEGKPYEYSKVAPGIGVINIFAFMTKDLRNYKYFLARTFKEIAKDSIHSLIIDVRGNFGGWPRMSSHLLHYISNTYYKTMAKSSVKISQPYRDYFYNSSPSLRQWTGVHVNDEHSLDIQSILRNKLNTYVDEEGLFNEPPEVKPNEYTGACYLLINRDSYSAASSFAATFQCYAMGTIIGEETGGTKIFRANSFSEKLSRSKLSVSISTTKLYTTCYSDKVEGVHPHIEFTPNIFGLIADIDTQLQFTMNIINKVQKKKAALQD